MTEFAYHAGLVDGFVRVFIVRADNYIRAMREHHHEQGRREMNQSMKAMSDAARFVGAAAKAYEEARTELLQALAHTATITNLSKGK